MKGKCQVSTTKRPATVMDHMATISSFNCKIRPCSSHSAKLNHWLFKIEHKSLNNEENKGNARLQWSSWNSLGIFCLRGMILLYKECLSRELQDLQTAGRGARQRTSLLHPGYWTATPCSGFEQKKIKIEIRSITTLIRKFWGIKLMLLHSSFSDRQQQADFQSWWRTAHESSVCEMWAQNSSDEKEKFEQILDCTSLPTREFLKNPPWLQYQHIWSSTRMQI